MPDESVCPKCGTDTGFVQEHTYEACRIAELTRDLQQARDHIGGLTAALVVKKQKLADREKQIEGLLEVIAGALRLTCIMDAPAWWLQKARDALYVRQAGKERET